MKKLVFVLCLLFAFSLIGSVSSCSPKVGCELNEAQGPKTDKRGNLSMKRGRSNLFDKKTRKKMGKG